MRRKAWLVCVMAGFVLGLVSCAKEARPPVAVPRATIEAPSNVADGVLPGGNILACETYSLRELFKEQKPDPKKPWVGKYPQLTITTFPAFMKELGIKGVAINDWYLGDLNAPDAEQKLDR